MVDRIPTINKWGCGLLCHSHNSPTLYYQWPNWLRITLPLAQQKYPSNATNASTITVKLLKTGSNSQWVFFGLFVCCFFMHYERNLRTISIWPPTKDIIVIQVLSSFILFYSNTISVLLICLFCSQNYLFPLKAKKGQQKNNGKIQQSLTQC